MASSTGTSTAAKPAPPPGTHSFVVSGTRFDVSEHYKLIKPIGHGAYGVVVSANDEKNKDKVAIKKVPRAFGRPHWRKADPRGDQVAAAF